MRPWEVRRQCYQNSAIDLWAITIKANDVTNNQHQFIIRISIEKQIAIYTRITPKSLTNNCSLGIGVDVDGCRSLRCTTNAFSTRTICWCAVDIVARLERFSSWSSSSRRCCVVFRCRYCSMTPRAAPNKSLSVPTISSCCVYWFVSLLMFRRVSSLIAIAATSSGAAPIVLWSMNGSFVAGLQLRIVDFSSRFCCLMINSCSFVSGSDCGGVVATEVCTTCFARLSRRLASPKPAAAATAQTDRLLLLVTHSWFR